MEALSTVQDVFARCSRPGRKPSPRRGEPQVFKAFIEDYPVYSRRIFECAFRILRDRSDAEDTVQEVCMTVQKHADQFHGHSQFATWLYRITFNAALQCLRQRRRQMKLGTALQPFTAEGRHAAPVVDWSRSNVLEDAAYQHELRRAIRRALDKLNPLDRRVVFLSDGEDRSDGEIAQLLGLTISAVKSRLHRARLVLRAELTKRLGKSAGTANDPQNMP